MYSYHMIVEIDNTQVNYLGIFSRSTIWQIYVFSNWTEIRLTDSVLDVYYTCICYQSVNVFDLNKTVVD